MIEDTAILLDEVVAVAMKLERLIGRVTRTVGATGREAAEAVATLVIGEALARGVSREDLHRAVDDTAPATNDLH